MKEIIVRTFTACILMLLFVSCAQIGTIGLKKHEFDNIPAKIVWLQIPGLDEELLSILRFYNKSADSKSSFEKSMCVGKIWNYNLYSIRPSPRDGMMAQMTGSKNIKGDCTDYTRNPIWKALTQSGFVAGVFEKTENDNDSLIKAFECDSKNFTNDLFLWRMKFVDNVKVNLANNFFHYQDRDGLYTPGVYYDKSCQKEGCLTSLVKNIKSLYQRFNASRPKNIFIVRDFTFYNAMKRQDIQLAIESLLEIESLYEYFLNEQRENKTLLLIVSSTSSLKIELPTQGNEWRKFEQERKNILLKNQSLISSVWANGPKSENFCGIYDEAEVFQRILWSRKRNIWDIREYFSSEN